MNNSKLRNYDRIIKELGDLAFNEINHNNE
jgi:hypothetical protein